jgi:hypothetical protein
MAKAPNYSASLAANVYPLLAISCRQCGYTFFINALAAGVLVAEQPEPEANVDAAGEAPSTPSD